MKILIKLVLLINVFVSNIRYNWGHFLLTQIGFRDFFCLFATLMMPIIFFIFNNPHMFKLLKLAEISKHFRFNSHFMRFYLLPSPDLVISLILKNVSRSLLLKQLNLYKWYCILHGWFGQHVHGVYKTFPPIFISGK